MSLKWITALALLAIAAACSRGGSKGLSVSTRAEATPQQVSATGLALENGITIGKIRMVVREVELEGGDAATGGNCDDDEMDSDASSATASAGAASTAHDGGGDECEAELEFGPFPVEVEGDALTGAVTFAFDVPVPEGTFEELEIKINTIPREKAGTDPVLIAMAEAHASISVEGVIDAGTPGEKPFTFQTPMEVTQKREGEIRIGGGTNVTLDFDPSGWFTAPDGTRLDPTDPVNQGQIRENIRASIRLVKDDDADGCDDDHDDGCAAHR